MDNEANLGGRRRTKTTMLNQVGIDDGVEEKGVDAVIHVVIHIIARVQTIVFYIRDENRNLFDVVVSAEQETL